MLHVYQIDGQVVWGMEARTSTMTEQKRPRAVQTIIA